VRTATNILTVLTLLFTLFFTNISLANTSISNNTSIDDIVYKIGSDPEFKEILRDLIDSSIRQHHKNRKMSAEELKKYKATLTTAKNYPSKIEDPQLIFSYVLGKNRVVVKSDQNKLKKLITKYKLGSFSKNDLKTIFENAALHNRSESESLVLSIEYELNPYPHQEPSVTDGCLEKCALKFTVAAVIEMSGAIGGLAACTLTGPAWPLCVAGVYGVAGYTIAQSNDALKLCQDKCLGNVPEDYCNSTLDCDDGESCYAPLIGQKKCRKVNLSMGQYCEKNSQCITEKCEQNECVCSDESHCLSGESCYTSGKNYCESTTLALGQSCSKNSQCLSDKCESGECVCSLDRDCDTGAGYRCATWATKPNECVLTCNSNSDCPGDQKCKQPLLTNFKRCK
jgi:hypothetical protein